MKSLTRTIIVLVVFNLAMGSFALAQAEGPEGSAEPTVRRLGRSPIPPKLPVPTPVEPTPPIPPEPKQALHIISGNTGLSGVTMHGLPGNPVTDTRGYYTATVPHGFTGRVMPVKEGFSFEPAIMIYHNVVSDRTNQNYSVTPITFTISGELGVGGVEMRGLPGNPVTGRNGTYQATVNYGWSGTVKPTKEGYAFEPPNLSYSRVAPDLTNQNYSPKRVGPAPMLGRTGGRKVLVIPETDVKVEDLVEITQDLQVMSHIFDEKFKEPRTIKGMFTDFGDFFGRDSRSTEAIYIQGYGTLFLMEVNFTFSPPAKVQEKEDEKTEDVDPIWQRTKQKIFSPRGLGGGSEFVSEEKYSAEKIDQLKTELIKMLKHAANIRNLKPDEWIIVTVIGQGRQGGVMYFSNKSFGSAAPRSNYSSSYSASEQSASSEGGGYAASRSSGVAGGGMDGYGGGMGGFGGRMGGMAGMGMGMGGMYGEMGFPTATILTIRAKKSDVDDFAKGELDFEEFQEKVEIFTY